MSEYISSHESSLPVELTDGTQADFRKARSGLTSYEVVDASKKATEMAELHTTPEIKKFAPHIQVGQINLHLMHFRRYAKKEDFDLWEKEMQQFEPQLKSEGIKK
jgi:hypothetical protein